MTTVSTLTKREMQLLIIVARYMDELARKYPAAARAFEDMQGEIIALTIDWNQMEDDRP